MMEMAMAAVTQAQQIAMQRKQLDMLAVEHEERMKTLKAEASIAMFRDLTKRELYELEKLKAEAGIKSEYMTGLSNLLGGMYEAYGAFMENDPVGAMKMIIPPLEYLFKKTGMPDEAWQKMYDDIYTLDPEVYYKPQYASRLFELGNGLKNTTLRAEILNIQKTAQQEIELRDAQIKQSTQATATSASQQQVYQKQLEVATAEFAEWQRTLGVKQRNIDARAIQLAPTIGKSWYSMNPNEKGALRDYAEYKMGQDSAASGNPLPAGVITAYMNQVSEIIKEAEPKHYRLRFLGGPDKEGVSPREKEWAQKVDDRMRALLMNPGMNAAHLQLTGQLLASQVAPEELESFFIQRLTEEEMGHYAENIEELQEFAKELEKSLLGTPSPPVMELAAPAPGTTTEPVTPFSQFNQKRVVPGRARSTQNMMPGMTSEAQSLLEEYPMGQR